MNEKFNKNAKLEQLTKMFYAVGKEKGLIVKDPLQFLLVLGVMVLGFINSYTI